MKLYRGFFNTDEIKEVMETNKNREPVDLDPKIHDIADKYFLDKFGFRFRSQIVFCTGDINVADDYGEVRVIEPIGKYEICWSPKVKDFLEIQYSITGDITEHVEKFIENNNYQIGNMEAAIESKNEIMLYCDKYRVLKVDD